MEYRRLGNTELKTASIVFGGNVFGWTLDEKASFKMLDEVTDMGIQTIDTADVYSRWAEGNSGGESESIIGKWMRQKGNRSQINLITKVGSDMGQGKKDLSADHILKACDASLKRLQTDYIDLYLTHWDDHETPVEETLAAYQRLMQEGKVRYIGASNLSIDRLQASLDAAEHDGLPRYEVFQPGYNLYDRSEYENGVKHICEKENLGVIPYFALGSGYLTGKYRKEEDFKGEDRASFVKKYHNERGIRILTALDEVAEKSGKTHAALALAWLMAQPSVTAPIASATSSTQLQAFKEAISYQLPLEELEILNRASSYK
jgi:aryl-alcohol dehydrogenase-like predicted oxidoreductase